MSQPSQSSFVKFTYVPTGQSLPDPLDPNTIYFVEETQRIIVAGISIYNPVVYNSDPLIAPNQVLLTMDEYLALEEVDPDTLYLIYGRDMFDQA